MGEAIWCRVQFRTPAGWGADNDLVTGLTASLGEYDEDDEWTIQGEGNYGLYDSEVEFWLDWMIEHKVPFIATSESKYEYEGETRVFDGHGMWTGQSGVDSALMNKETYESIKAGDSDFGSVEDYFDTLNVSTTTGFSIDHLSDKFPSDEDEEFTVSVPAHLETFMRWDGTDVRGSRCELLLLARTIHDMIEGADDEHVSG